jgi:hypothetical protein
MQDWQILVAAAAKREEEKGKGKGKGGGTLLVSAHVYIWTRSGCGSKVSRCLLRPISLFVPLFQPNSSLDK